MPRVNGCQAQLNFGAPCKSGAAHEFLRSYYYRIHNLSSDSRSHSINLARLYIAEEHRPVAPRVLISNSARFPIIFLADCDLVWDDRADLLV